MTILIYKMPKYQLIKGLNRISILSLLMLVCAVLTSSQNQSYFATKQEHIEQINLNTYLSSTSSTLGQIETKKEPFKSLWLFAGGLTAGIIIEAFLSKKIFLCQQTKQDLQQLQGKARQLKSQLEEQIAEIPLLIAHKGQTRANLASYYLEQEQQSQELASAIAEYERQISDRVKDQKKTLKALEDLQEQLESLEWQKNAPQEMISQGVQQLEKLQRQILIQEQEKADKLQILAILRQQLQETHEHEQEVRQRLHKLNQKINDLTCDRNEARSKLENLEQQLANFPNFNGLIAALESARDELERVKEQSKQFEQYVLAENEDLETKNQQLQDKLGLANAKIQYLQYTLEQNKISMLAKDSYLDSDSYNERFLLIFSPHAYQKLRQLAETDSKKYRKICKTLDTMSANLRHHSLRTHEYAQISGPNGEKVFESYVEHRTPSAWRVFWYYGPGQKFLTIQDLSPHP